MINVKFPICWLTQLLQKSAQMKTFDVQSVCKYSLKSLVLLTSMTALWRKTTEHYVYSPTQL